MIPYPNPYTRDQARDNAIYLAKIAEEGNAQWATPLAGVWASVAHAFPEQVVEDHRPYPAQDATEVIPRVEPNNVMVSISRSAHDALRVLAIRHLWQLNGQHRAVLTMSEIEDDLDHWDVKIYAGDQSIDLSVRSTDGT